MGTLPIWLIVILFTAVVEVQLNDLTLKVTGGSQQAVDVVGRTVSQRERQQLLSCLQVSVSFTLTKQTAHVPGRTVSWRKEKADWGHIGSDRQNTANTVGADFTSPTPVSQNNSAAFVVAFTTVNNQHAN